MFRLMMTNQYQINITNNDISQLMMAIEHPHFDIDTRQGGIGRSWGPEQNFIFVILFLLQRYGFGLKMWKACISRQHRFYYETGYASTIEEHWSHDPAAFDTLFLDQMWFDAWIMINVPFLSSWLSIEVQVWWGRGLLAADRWIGNCEWKRHCLRW